MQWKSVEDNPPEETEKNRETEKRCLFSSGGKIYFGLVITYLGDSEYSFYFVYEIEVPCPPCPKKTLRFIVPNVEYYMLVENPPGS